MEIKWNTAYIEKQRQQSLEVYKQTRSALLSKEMILHHPIGSIGWWSIMWSIVCIMVQYMGIVVKPGHAFEIRNQFHWNSKAIYS